MLENCRGGPRPVRLCVEKTKYFGQIQQPRTCIQKWTKILIHPFFPKFEAPSVGGLPYMLETCTGAVGLLGGVLKRLKILVKFNFPGPLGKNGPKFLSAPFPQI